MDRSSQPAIFRTHFAQEKICRCQSRDPGRTASFPEVFLRNAPACRRKTNFRISGIHFDIVGIGNLADEPLGRQIIAMPSEYQATRCIVDSERVLPATRGRQASVWLQHSLNSTTTNNSGGAKLSLKRFSVFRQVGAPETS